MDLVVGNGEKAVKVAGLKSVGSEKFSAFDGITLTLEGGAVENFSDLTITGGANNVRRVIWSGEVDGGQRNAVLIVDNDGDGTLKGGWLILGNEQNVLTYYTDAAKISAEEDAAIALTPRRFTFIEKTSAGDGAILSIGAAFDDVTISAGATNPIYLSRTVNGSKLNGVLQPLATAQVNSEKWSFNDADSFIVEDGKKVFRGTDEFACESELAQHYASVKKDKRGALDLVDTALSGAQLPETYSRQNDAEKKIREIANWCGADLSNFIETEMIRRIWQEASKRR